jgi:hypothetical protein
LGWKDYSHYDADGNGKKAISDFLKENKIKKRIRAPLIF